MKRCFAILFLVILPITSLSAGETDRIAVLDFHTSGVSEGEMQLFTDYIATRISQHGDYTLIDRRQRDSILSELSFSNSGCTDEECQLEIGRLLSANVIVVGSLGSIGSIYLLNMHLVDVETSTTLRTVSRQYDELDLLVKDSEHLVAELLGHPAMETFEVTEDVPEESQATEETGAGGGSCEKEFLLAGVHYVEGPVTHYSRDFGSLGERMVMRLNTPNAEELLQEYASQLKRSSNLSWMATGCAAGGALLAMEGLNNPPADDEGNRTGEVSPLAVAGLAVEAAGIVLMFMSGNATSRAVGAFDELVALYNRSLK